MREWEYSIRPISFADYGELISQIQEDADDGWVFVGKIEEYIDSPIVGVTTFDFLCRKKIKKK